MNMATIIAAGLVVLATAGAIASQIRRKKQGKSACGYNCSGCALSGVCRKQNKNS